MKKIISGFLFGIVIFISLNAQTIKNVMSSRNEFLRLKQRMNEHLILDSLRMENVDLFKNESVESVTSMTQNNNQEIKTLAAFQSNGSIYVPDTVIAYSTTDTARYIYTLEQDGKKITELCEIWSNKKWLNNRRIIIIYGIDKEEPISAIFEVWLLDKWIMTEKYLNVFDDKGNSISFLEEEYESGVLIESDREINSYDANGNLLTSTDENWTNNEWVNSSRSTYSYNANGKKLTQLYERWMNNAWVAINKYTYDYDAYNNQIMYISENWSYDFGQNGKYSAYKYTWTYDSSGNKLSYTSQTWGTNDWGNPSRHIYTYNSNLKLITDLYQFFSNSEWKNQNRTTYSYDYSGNQIGWLHEKFENYAWVFDNKNTRTYNASGLKLSDLNENWINNTWVNSFKETNTYDNFGNVLVKYLQSWGYSQYTLKHTYTYNSAGKLLTWLYEDLGSNYYKSSKGLYNWDNNGNIISVEYYDWNTSLNKWEPKNEGFSIEILDYEEDFEIDGAKFLISWKLMSYIQFSQKTLSIAAPANSTNTFDITSNTAWTISKNQDWLSLNTTSGTGNATITLTASANLSSSSREATILVSGTGISTQSIIVTQEKNTASLTLSAQTLTIGATDNSTNNFDITSNTAWTISKNQDWLSINTTSGSGNATITLTASANLSTASREATVLVTGTGISTQTITVTQEKGTAALTVSPQALTIGAPANSSKTFDITSNTAWTISKNQDWLSINTTSGTGNATVTLTASANLSTVSREAIILVSGTGISTQTITVSQNAADVTLSVSPGTLTIGAKSFSTKTFDIISNTTWTVVCNQDWLTANNTSGSGNVTITLTAAGNPNADTRTANVIISGIGATNKVIAVTQEAATTGISESNYSSVSIYPIPATEEVTIENLPSNSIIQVFDFRSKLLISKTANSETMSIDISNLSKGIYAVKIQSEKGVFTKTIIKL